MICISGVCTCVKLREKRMALGTFVTRQEYRVSYGVPSAVDSTESAIGDPSWRMGSFRDIVHCSATPRLLTTGQKPLTLASRHGHPSCGQNSLHVDSELLVILYSLTGPKGWCLRSTHKRRQYRSGVSPYLLPPFKNRLSIAGGCRVSLSSLQHCFC